MWRWDSEFSMRPLLFGYDIAEAMVVRDKKLVHFGGRSRLRVSDPAKYRAEIKSHTGLSAEDVAFLDLYYGKVHCHELGLSQESAQVLLGSRLGGA